MFHDGIQGGGKRKQVGVERRGPGMCDDELLLQIDFEARTIQSQQDRGQSQQGLG